MNHTPLFEELQQARTVLEDAVYSASPEQLLRLSQHVDLLINKIMRVQSSHFGTLAYTSTKRNNRRSNTANTPIRPSIHR